MMRLVIVVGRRVCSGCEIAAGRAVARRKGRCIIAIVTMELLCADRDWRGATLHCRCSKTLDGHCQQHQPDDQSFQSRVHAEIVAQA
jgi:hypothetical protein